MTEPVFVKTEFTDGKIGGTDYGSSVRVLLRSPKAVMFTGLGFNIWSPRGSNHHSQLKHISYERPNKAELAKPEVIEKIDAEFGPGAGALALKAWLNKGTGTCLIDGGGDPMPPTRVAFRAKLDIDYAAISSDWSADLTGQVKTCKQCGKNLQPATDIHWMGHDVLPDHPQTVDDCQRRTNHRVIAVHSYGRSHMHKAQYVERFETWDGETYQDDDFCYGERCASDYGRRAARQLPLLEAGGEVPRTPYYRRTDTKHYEPPPPRIFTLGDGSTIKA